MTILEKINAAAELNPTVNGFVRKDGVVKQSFTLVKDAETPGNFYLQGRVAASKPAAVFADIFEKAESDGMLVEILQ